MSKDNALLHPGQGTHLIREIMLTHHALLNVFSREVGVTSARLVLLRFVAISGPEGIGVMDLARLLGVNAAAVTRQIKDMEKDGLVARCSDSRDGRRSHILLSENGRQLFRSVHDRAHEFEKGLSASAGEEDVATAVSVLAKVRASIERLG